LRTMKDDNSFSLLKFVEMMEYFLQPFSLF
jgi:hypothetical protein